MYQQQNDNEYHPPPKNEYYGQPPQDHRRFQYGKSAYRDKYWAIAFYMHISLIIACAFLFGPALMDAIRVSGPSKTLNITDSKRGMIAIIVASIAGIGFGFFWLHMMKTVKMITLLYIKLGFLAGATLAGFWVSIYTGIIGSFFFALTIFWFYAVRSRIPFSEVMLRTSTRSLQDHSGAIAISIILAVVSIIWVSLWSFTTMSIFHRVNPPNQQVKSSGVVMFYYFLLLISLYWTCEVIKNVGHVTTAGTVASWWLLPGQMSPTMSALKRSLTTSFGSICFGSLLVAVIKAVREILAQVERQARESDNGGAACLLAITQCCLGCIESMVEYFNVYAYTHIAIYGDDYITSAKAVRALFQGNGFTMLINDDLTGWVIGLGCLLGGIMTALVSGIWAVITIEAWWPILMSLGFVIGIFMTALVTNPVACAITTTYVCWAEDPAAMKSGRPSDFKDITDAARGQQPSWDQ